MFAIRDERDYVVQARAGQPQGGGRGEGPVLDGLHALEDTRRACSVPCQGSQPRVLHGAAMLAAPTAHALDPTAALPPTATPLLPGPPQEDFMKAVRKLGEAKKLEGHLAYSADFGDGGKS